MIAYNIIFIRFHSFLQTLQFYIYSFLKVNKRSYYIELWFKKMRRYALSFISNREVKKLSNLSRTRRANNLIPEIFKKLTTVLFVISPAALPCLQYLGFQIDVNLIRSKKEKYG